MIKPFTLDHQEKRDRREGKTFCHNPLEDLCIRSVEAHKLTRYPCFRASRQSLGELCSVGYSPAPNSLHRLFLKTKILWHDRLDSFQVYQVFPAIGVIKQQNQ